MEFNADNFTQRFVQDHDSHLSHDSAVDESSKNYEHAEKRARWYLNKIACIANNPDTFSRLHRDFKLFLQERKNTPASRIALMQRAANGELSTWNFLDKLAARQELDAYLSKTISYLYLRDLGLDLNQAEAKQKVKNSVNSLIEKIQNKAFSQASKQANDFHLPWLNKKQFRPAYYWLMVRLRSLREHLNCDNNDIDGTRKLVKVVAGILMHHMMEAPEPDRNDPNKLTEVVKLGYAYGLTYPFVDDLLDSSAVLNKTDKVIFSHALRQSLKQRSVAGFPEFTVESKKLKRIYSELKWAFEYIQTTLSPAQNEAFFQRATVFFESQSIDRERSLQQASKYSLHEILTTVILKSASSRLLSRDLVAKNEDQDFDYRTFCFGIYNQFNDDIKDIEEDIGDDNLTPYTWYLARQSEADKNPYHYYWAVLHYLVYEVYANNTYIKSLFFERSMNAISSVYHARDAEDFTILRQDLLHTPLKAFDEELHQQVVKHKQEVWFDKLISQEVSKSLSTKQNQSNSFKTKYYHWRDKINQQLPIEAHQGFIDGKLHELANYAVGAGGKRIRAVMASVLSRHLYNFSDEQQQEVNQLLEYMHSASLILDDLPSQDNAELRRGKPATHVHCKSVAKAELASVYLMMKAIEVQAGIETHPAKAVLKSLQYAASVTQAISEGQLLDIESSGRRVTQSCLEKICHFKTSLAIEAALMIPAILAEQDDLHKGQLKQLAMHMGLMFQIRDDLLDISGTEDQLGKEIGSDESNLRMNFVSVFGEQKAIDIMFEHHEAANKVITQFPPIKGFFSELLDYIIYRNK